MASSTQDEELSEFISPFLKSKGTEKEIVLVAPQEPSRSKKVYVIKKDAGLTGRNYMQCSSCHHSSFKFYRSVTRASVPDHLKYLGTSDSDQLRFCRSCWYGATSSSSGASHDSVNLINKPRVSNYKVSKPHFDREPLGITDQRACFSWHFIQRDFVRRKASSVEKNPGKHDITLPLVSVIGQAGNEFICKGYNANRFNVNGKEVSLHSESEYGPKGSTPEHDDEMDSVSSILLNIQRDHDYAPSMQREVEVTTSAGSPIKNAYQNNSKGAKGVRVNENNISGKQKPTKEPVHQMTSKSIKAQKLFEGHQQLWNNVLIVNMPVSKVEEQLRTKREKGEGPDPNHLSGLKATAENGQTVPGLICPLCGKHTVKSYSVWKKDTAPPKIKHLFKDGVTIIRACRKCVPYPLNREKKHTDRNGNFESLPSKALSKTMKNSTQPNRKRIAINGCMAGDNSGKIGSLATASKGQVSKIEVKASKVRRHDHVLVNVGVRVARVNVNSTVKNEQPDLIKDRKKQRTLEEKCDEMIKRNAKLEEKKRKIELHNGGELTGLECFESLQSDENMNGFDENGTGDNEDENWLLCKETHNDDIITEGNTANTKGGPRDRAMICDKCKRPLGKTFKTIKQSRCPKRFAYFFVQNKIRSSMRICKSCTKK